MCPSAPAPTLPWGLLHHEKTSLSFRELADLNRPQLMASQSRHFTPRANTQEMINYHCQSEGMGKKSIFTGTSFRGRSERQDCRLKYLQEQ